MKNRAALHLLIALGVAGISCSAVATPIYGLSTANLLLRFDSTAPGTSSQVLIISGLQSGEVLQAIDFRPASGELLGLGNSNRVYVISTNTGAATALGGAPFGVLSGAAFGFDVNPTVDRIRTVSDLDQNLRLNPTNGTLTSTDGVLAYAIGDLNAGANPNVVGCAYLNNYPGATSTTLYGIDSTLDVLVIQNPPNNGTLNTVGALGFNTSSLCGFDISARNEAFAALTAPGDTVSKLFQINLSTGAATFLGNIGGAVLSGIAIVPPPMVRFASTQYSATESSGKAILNLARFNDASGTTTVNYSTTPGTASAGVDYQPVAGTVSFAPGETNKSFEVPLSSDGIPELNETVLLAISAADTNALVAGFTNAILEIVSDQDLPVYLLTVSNQLLRFSTSPSVIQTNLSITGLQSGEALLAIDFRPATGQLYGLGSSNRLYVINTGTGIASPIGSAGAFTLSGTEFGFDFNPTVDRIRVVSDADQNLRLNPNDGTLVFADTILNPGTPNVIASAYINNFAGSPTTVLYGIDSGSDVLVLQNPPNNGTLTPIGALGVDIVDVGGFDYTEADKAAYAVLKRSAGATSEIYRINLTTGAAALLGAVNSAAVIRGIAISDPQPTLKIAQVGTNAVLSWSAASAGYVLERSGSLSVPNWDTNLATPVVVADQKVVTNALVSTNHFFRLKK